MNESWYKDIEPFLIIILLYGLEVLKMGRLMILTDGRVRGSKKQFFCNCSF